VSDSGRAEAVDHFVENRGSTNMLELSQTVIRRFSSRTALTRNLISNIQTVCLSLDSTAGQRFLAIGRHEIWKGLQILNELIERHVSDIDQKVGQFFFAITGCFLSDFDLTRLAFAYRSSRSEKQILLELLYKEVLNDSEIINDSVSIQIVPTEQDVLLLDVTHTKAYPLLCGIQRLVRKCCEEFRASHSKHKLIRKTPGLFTFELFDKESESAFLDFALFKKPLRKPPLYKSRRFINLALQALLSPTVLHLFAEKLEWVRRRRLLAGKAIQVPLFSNGTVLAIEVLTEALVQTRPELYLQLKRHYPVTIGMVCYDLIPVLHPEYTPPSHRAAFGDYMRMLRIADRISCISEYIRRQVEFFINLVDRRENCPPRLAAHPLAGDIRVPRPQAPELSSPIETKPLILSVGALEPRKNQIGTIRASILLWNRGLKFKLIIAGAQGWLDSLILREVGDAVRAGYDLEITSDISESELARLYESARFTVFCSFTEGFGLPILESHSFGKPCVTSNVGSMAEVAKDGGCVLVDPYSPESIAEGMSQLLENHSLYSKLCEQIRTKHTRTWKEYAADIYKFFTEA